MIKQILCLVILTLVTTPMLYAQTEVALEASKDNTLYEDAAGALSNGAGDYLFVGRTKQRNNSLRRALVAFDLTNDIPAGATITSAQLTLSMDKTIAGAQTVDLHEVQADWGEGTSNAGGAEGDGGIASTGDATWMHTSFNTATWTNQGGDFEATASANQSVSVNGSYSWESEQMVADVQAWLDTPETNFGWILIGNETVITTAKRFLSRENGAAAFRPTLTVGFMTATDTEADDIPTSFSLEANYPNPFNPTTTIQFALPQAAAVRLAVYDLLGRQVQLLVEEQRPAGRHEVAFEASGLPSGVYFYRIEAGPFTTVRQMLLLK